MTIVWRPRLHGDSLTGDRDGGRPAAAPEARPKTWRTRRNVTRLESHKCATEASLQGLSANEVGGEMRHCGTAALRLRLYGYSSAE
jgi:hypothetical protein